MSHTEYYRGLAAASAALAAHATAMPAARAEAVHTAVLPLLDVTPEAAARRCRRGCAHCCHLPVGVTFGEGMRLAAALASHPARGAVAAAAAATRDLAWSALAGRACPLLHHGACVAHAERPLACRALASSDDAACAGAVHGPGPVPVDETAWWRGAGAGAALAAAEPGAAGHRELRSALAAVLAALDRAEDPAAAFSAARRAGEPSNAAPDTTSRINS